MEKEIYKICLLCKIKKAQSNMHSYCDECAKIKWEEEEEKGRKRSREASRGRWLTEKDNPFIGIKRRLQTRGRMKNHYYNNENYQIALRLRVCLNNALKSYTGKKKTISSKKYGIDYKKILKHLSPFPNNLSEYHIDHIRPLCSFDLTKPDEVKKAFAPENLQWLLAKDNRKKGKRWDGKKVVT